MTVLNTDSQLMVQQAFGNDRNIKTDTKIKFSKISAKIVNKINKQPLLRRRVSAFLNAASGLGDETYTGSIVHILKKKDDVV